MPSKRPAASVSSPVRSVQRAPDGTPARRRLLRAAARLFYSEGIQSVGVDRLVAEAEVTKATFYRHFPSKDDLVRAYIQERHQEARATADTLIEQVSDPSNVIAALATQVSYQVCTPDFRGCAFIGAAVEYPDPAHPVRLAVAEHRRWFRTLLTRLLSETGHPQPEAAAQTLVLLRDGAMMGGYLDDPAATTAALRTAIDHLLLADR